MMNWTFVFKLMLALCVPFLCHGFGFSRPATARHLNMNRNSGLRRFIMSSDSAKCKPVTGTAVRRVSSHSWRWPKSWPFPPDTFELDQSNPKTPGDKSYCTDKVFDFFENNKDDLGETLIVGVHVDNAIDRAKALGWETVPDFKNLSLLAESAFDSIIIASGLDSMNDPLPVFNEIFSMLRPSGVLYACFDKKSQSPNPLKLWSTASDGQKVWLVGSFCHYSNPKGWSCIEGFDLESSSEAIESSESNHFYMIRAQKADLEDINASLDADELEKRIVPRLNSIRFKSPLEASLMAARLAQGIRSGKFVPSDFEQIVARLDDAYSILQGITESSHHIRYFHPKLSCDLDVNEVVIPIPARVSLAYSLLNDVSFISYILVLSMIHYFSVISMDSGLNRHHSEQLYECQLAWSPLTVSGRVSVLPCEI